MDKVILFLKIVWTYNKTVFKKKKIYLKKKYSSFLSHFLSKVIKKKGGGGTTVTGLRCFEFYAENK